MKLKKRFIAGASCPKCAAQDSLRWWVENSIEMVECVECHHLDKRLPKTMEQSEHSDQDMIGFFKP
ncbi:YheV family putative zinc ribbon protein [Vibrio sp. TH_r3]|uniref:YheV family putative zinc ribbon protein n=1 Tax=unclassified Vibrio TaxID=2614977 RepID=UPI0029536799|nr:YheV family putative zinc ribbon protein [Vibrio sp. TH_r3]MDV7105437.1 YheV family putative zinc ribbon protein [Vibrio sp. TH_r3]